MPRSAEHARAALMDSAEELWAADGIDAVSSRRIVEHAGLSNHSAVAYHFGTRDDLLRELLRRHTREMSARQSQLVAALGPEPSPHDILRCRLIPFVELLESLPRPSWRAEFLAQMAGTPSTAALIREHVEESTPEAGRSLPVIRVDGVSDAVMRARSGIVGHLVLGVCADNERNLNLGRGAANWIDVGHFLVDASVGMLTAPVTHPLHSRFVPASPDLF